VRCICISPLDDQVQLGLDSSDVALRPCHQILRRVHMHSVVNNCDDPVLCRDCTVACSGSRSVMLKDLLQAFRCSPYLVFTASQFISNLTSLFHCTFTWRRFPQPSIFCHQKNARHAKPKANAPNTHRSAHTTQPSISSSSTS
jgi:hypothetical protein